MKITAWFAAMLAQGDAPPAPVDEAKPPVVLVHGIHSSAADMVRLAQALRAVGRETHVIDLKPANGSAALEQLCSQLEDFIHSEIGQRRLDLVGYSMGGIISRYYVQKASAGAEISVPLCAKSRHGARLAKLRCRR
jgi:triacylglycerol lipase